MPPRAGTLGPEAVELAATGGLIADPWQADAVDDILAFAPDGKWAASEAGLIVPRQNGKGGILEIVVAAAMFLLSEKLILWSAHEVKTAMEAFRRILDLIESSPDMDAEVKRIGRGNGDESIELKSGVRLKFVARSKGAGRGFSAPRLIIDETFAYDAQQQAAIAPTMAAQPNPQIIYASTPPLDSITGVPLFGLRERAERGGDPDLCWLDWSLSPPDFTGDRERDVWRADPANWMRANPASPHRVSLAALERMHRSMDGDQFAREVLCVWPPKPSQGSVLDLGVWADLADTESRRSGPFALALDITPDRMYSTIAMAGVREDGQEHWEVVEHRSGTGWVVPRLAELKKRHSPVAIGLDVKGPAGSLVVDLAAVGIKPPEDPDRPLAGDLAIPHYQDVAASCGQMIDAVTQGLGRHRDQGPLNLAVAGAGTRPLGDARAWARKNANVPISPLVALSLARWCYQVRAELVAREYDPLANIF